MDVFYIAVSISLEVPLEPRKEEKVRRCHIWTVGGGVVVRQRGNPVLGQKLPHQQRVVARRVVVVNLPRLGDVWPHAENAFAQPVEHVHIENGIRSLSRGYELPVNHTTTVKKADERGFDP